MSNKYRAVIAAAALVGAFAFGRFTTPVKIKTETKIVTQTEVKQNTNTQVNVDQDKHVNTTTVEIKRPDGTVIIRTKTLSDTDTKKQENQNVKTDTKTDQVVTQTQTIERGSKSPVTISALAGANPFSLTDGFSYGAIVTKPILGPIVLGVWGISKPVFGVSLGLQF